MRPALRLAFEPRDLWVGIFWDFDRTGRAWTLDVYVCILPCLPIKLSWRSPR